LFEVPLTPPGLKPSLGNRNATESSMTKWSVAWLAGVVLLLPLGAAAQGTATALPPGPGKELVESLCTGFHQIIQVTPQPPPTQ
jgi:hypothetical protein